jgi:hypothetical protein
LSNAARRRVAAGAPHGRRVPTDGAESPEASEIERAEASHREAADRHASAVEAVTLDCGWDHLSEDVRAPAPVGAIVVVRAVAAVGEDDGRRPCAEFPDRVPQLAHRHLVGAARAAVEQDEQGAPVGAARRDDDGLYQAAPQEAAPDREMRSGAAAEAAAAGEQETEGREAPQRSSRDRRRSLSTRPPVWHSGQ